MQSRIRARRKSKPQNRRTRLTQQPLNKPQPTPGSILTVGHSTHPIERFLELLGQHRVASIADVRSYPSSRRWPHFNQAELAESLSRASVEYRSLRALGGRRSSKRPDSPHVAWELPAFRSYADYAESAEFESGLSELIAHAANVRTAYMCSEGLWWRCHRRIISDHLAIRGWTVEHIMPDGKLKPHVLAPFARIVDGRIIYDQAAKKDS